MLERKGADGGASGTSLSRKATLGALIAVGAVLFVALYAGLFWFAYWLVKTMWHAVFG